LLLVAYSTGFWKAVLPPMPAGGLYTMDIMATNHIFIHDYPDWRYMVLQIT